MFSQLPWPSLSGEQGHPAARGPRPAPTEIREVMQGSGGPGMELRVWQSRHCGTASAASTVAGVRQTQGRSLTQNWRWWGIWPCKLFSAFPPKSVAKMRQRLSVSTEMPPLVRRAPSPW